MAAARDGDRSSAPSAAPGAEAMGCSRRELVRAGLVGTAALSLGGMASAGPAGAEALGSSLAPGVYGLNQGWRFGRYVPGAESPAHDERRLASVTLPHTVVPLSWSDWDPRTWEHLWIYRRGLDGAALRGGRAFLDFQGVMTSAVVFLGGRRLGKHEGGYLPFSVELTRHLSRAEDVLAVVVDSRWRQVPPNAGAGSAREIDFLQPGGIYRDVALRITPEVFIADLFARPVDVLSGAPGVAAKVTLDAGRRTAGPLSVTVEVLDGGAAIGAASAWVPPLRPGRAVVELALSGLTGVTLWSPATPRLYQVRAEVRTAAGVTHAVQVNTGFRQASFEPDGFYLNGERLQVFGVNRHQLFPYTGMAAPERLQRRDAELLKNRLGCNMVRCSHYPQSPHFLDACDELGLMVWEEAPGWQHMGGRAAQKIVVENVRDMVVRDRNRPSVIVWGTRLDETADYPELYARTRALAYAVDGTRQTTGAMHLQSTAGWAEDVFAYDDYHSLDGNAMLEPPLTGLPYLVSEAVGARDGSPLYRWIDPGATLALQGRLHGQVHGLAQTDTAYAGVLAWSAIDYASLHGGDRIWRHLKWSGVLDTFRVAKPAAAVYASQADPSLKAVVAPLFFWDFGPLSPAGGPGPGSMIATNCERLELYLDDRPLATALPDEEDFAGLAHPPALVDLVLDGSSLPELRIDGYVGGQVVTSLRMSSDPARDRLALTIEDPSILGDGSDATRFSFRALDAYGNQRPYPQGDVALALSGPARLIAESPFPFSQYGGVGGGLVQSLPGTQGIVTLTAQHPTLGQAAGGVLVERAPAAGASGCGGSAPPRVIDRA